MSTIPEILTGLEKRIMVLERLAGIEPDPATLMHPKSGKQDDFRVAEAAKIAKELIK
jgi:hypothetical protein